MVIATFKGGPVSVLPLKTPTEETDENSENQLTQTSVR